MNDPGNEQRPNELLAEAIHRTELRLGHGMMVSKYRIDDWNVVKAAALRAVRTLSDEEIEARVNDLDDRMKIHYHERHAYADGAKWYRAMMNREKP